MANRGTRRCCGPIVRNVEADIKYIQSEIEAFQKIKKSASTKGEVLSAFEAVRETFRRVHRSMLFTYYHGDTKYDDICCFDSLGGINLLVKYHEEIYFITRDSFFEEIHKYFVASTMTPCIGYFKCAKDNTLRKRLVEAGALDKSIDVFLEAPISIYSHDSGRIFHSMRAVCRISPLPEIHLKISKNGDLLDKILLLLNSPKYSLGEEMVLSFRLLQTIAQSKECHKNLLKPKIIEKLIAGIEFRSRNKSDAAVPILCCYFGCLLAEMVLGSSSLFIQHFSKSTRSKLVTLMEKVLKYNIETIAKYEHKYRMQGGSYLCIAYLFEPMSGDGATKASATHNTEFQRLWQLSVDVLLFFLQFSIKTEERVNIVKDENMLEYLIMLPWYVPATSRDRAINVVINLANICQMQPPSLQSICEAKLARVKGGLINILNSKSMSQVVTHLSCLKT